METNALFIFGFLRLRLYGVLVFVVNAKNTHCPTSKEHVMNNVPSLKIESVNKDKLLKAKNQIPPSIINKYSFIH